MTGLLQVFFDGSWSQVCGGRFEVADVNVTCRQLGVGAGTIVPQFPSTRRRKIKPSNTKEPTQQAIQQTMEAAKTMQTDESQQTVRNCRAYAILSACSTSQPCRGRAPCRRSPLLTSCPVNAGLQKEASVTKDITAGRANEDSGDNVSQVHAD